MMKMIINGIECNASDEKVISVINPSTKEVIDTVPDASENDVDYTIKCAFEGKKHWANIPLFQRIEILWKFTELLEKQKKELSEIMCQEIGKPYLACEDEVLACIGIFRAYCEKARNLCGKTMPLNSEARVRNDLILNIREPLGVVVLIIPFNYPTELYAHKVAPALVTGNSVIVKPASEAPLGNIFLTQLLLEAGVPGSAIQAVTGSGTHVGKWLNSSDKINAISLTGSTQVGILTSLVAAQNLTKVLLELGGNDPLIIFNDADIDLAVSESIIGRLSNSGQTCCGSKRFIIQKDIKEIYVNRLIERLKKVKMGDPFLPETECGPLVSEKAAILVESQVKNTIEQGAVLRYGGNRIENTFFEPTILDNINPNMEIAKDMEIFGPVFPIIEFESCEEAIKIANSSSFGLSGGVLTSDMSVALKVAKELETGTCVINGCGNYRSAHMPFGGYKKSGIGREGVTETLEEYTQIKNIAFKSLF